MSSKETIPRLSSNAFHVPIHLITAGRSPPPRTGRSICGVCLCSMAPLMFVLGTILVLSPFVRQTPFFWFFLSVVVAGFPALIVGLYLLWQEREEFRIVHELLASQEEMSLEQILTETNIPPLRSRIYIQRAIQVSKITGRLVDDKYVRKLIAERIDTETIRCPHCKAEMKLAETKSDSDWFGTDE